MIFYDFKDDMTQSFSGTFFSAMNNDCAKRSVRLALQSGKGLPGVMLESPRDFTLYQVGEYDQQTGAFVPGLKYVASFMECVNGTDKAL